MSRHFSDWIGAYMDYAQYTEAPRHMHFWSATSAIAGALRRQVWIDQAFYKWYCNLYIVLVAPPGIVAKSTTTGIAMSLLRQVPAVHFGPDVVTWQALVEQFSQITEEFSYQDAFHPMSAMTLESSEFGNLLDPKDTQMIDLLVSLWDGKQGGFSKKTKTSGSEVIPNPWINLIACTTPSWIAGNFPEYMIGGGFTSRTIFVYADKKGKEVAYPGRHVPPNMKETEAKLVEDLIHISKLTGEYKLTDACYAWGEAWYSKLWKTRPSNMDKDRFGGYFARKQAMLHKVAMIIAASSSDELVLQPDHLEIANDMLTDLEPDLQFIFSKVGRTNDSLYVEKLIDFVATHPEGVSYQEAFRYVHNFFPSMRGFEDFIAGCIGAGYVRMQTANGKNLLFPGQNSLPASSR